MSEGRARIQKRRLEAMGLGRGMGRKRKRALLQTLPATVRLMHPLLFMKEEEVQALEQREMAIEDAISKHIMRSDSALQHRKDYEAYFSLACRYGPQSAETFMMTPKPGQIYWDLVRDAAQTLQSWW
ncbi:unnamed protein product [Chrysoparadoxa australica]